MAVTDQIAEAYARCTEGCGVVDRSELGKLALTGPQAKAALNAQVTNDVEALSRGEGLYAAFLTGKGKMLGDLRALDLGDELLLVCERVALQGLFDLLRRGLIGWDAELHKRTLDLGVLSLVGPRADAVAGDWLSEDLRPEEHAIGALSLNGIDGWAVRTDVGLDLVLATAQVADALAALENQGAAPVPEEAAEIVRVERGRPRYGVDLDDSVIPQEAGLNERAVSFTKGCYVGQETVARLHYKGKPNRHLRGLTLSAPAASGDSLTHDGRQVGRLGSAVVSPRLGPIALALVRREAAPGATVSVGEDGLDAQVVELPFEWFRP